MLKLLTDVTQIYCHPDAPIGSAGPTLVPGGGGGKESTIDFLSQDDEPEIIPLDDKKTPPKETKKAPKEEETTEEDEPEEEPTTEEDTDEETDEEDEDEELSLEDEFEEDLKEPSEEDLELVTPVRRREILKKYPNLFKDFPYLEKAYWREQQFTEVFPTIDDAKTAREDAQILTKFEGDLLKGDIQTVLKAVKDKSPNAFNKVANNYLKTLADVDERAYLNVISNLTKHTISSMAAKARSSNNEALMQAATILNQFVFGSDEWVPPKELEVKEDEPNNPKEKEISDREKAFNQRQFETARTDINTRVGNSLKATIDANIDPKKAMTDYVRKNASRDAMEILTGLINKDTRFKALNEKLWEAAFKANFSKESTDRIRAAHLSKAKTLLPSVLKKARIDALRGMGKRVRESADEDNNETTERKAPLAARKPASSGNKGGHKVGKVTNAKDIPKGMSTLEFLNSD